MTVVAVMFPLFRKAFFSNYRRSFAPAILFLKNYLEINSEIGLSRERYVLSSCPTIQTLQLFEAARLGNIETEGAARNLAA
jgi:hypothetical protein